VSREPARFVYVHVPFCARRCSYCDFAIAVRRQVPWRAFADRVQGELRVRGEPPRRVETLYLGGGTPSRLGADGVRALLDVLHDVAMLEPGAEVTLEVNPEDVTAASARAWAAAGITRVSLGVQSFQDPVLRWMHRVHDASAVPQAVATLRAAGLHDLSVDLIFAVPPALARDWSADVEAALALEPTHVSLYGLTLEPGTPLGRWAERGEVLEAPDEQYEADFLRAHTAFTAAGFEHYEVSNYGRPGHRARHNSAYWRQVPYLGVGPSAHGFDGSVRRWNRRGYVAWDADVAAGRDPLEGSERLTDGNRIAESVYLGLRTCDGLVIEPGEASVIEPWRDAGWVTVAADGWMRCTPLGWLRLDGLAAALTAHRSR
jgi:oxygen-independent coproporphyrinogen-3 oxidase